jgi:hypothetical protein
MLKTESTPTTKRAPHHDGRRRRQGRLARTHNGRLVLADLRQQRALAAADVRALRRELAIAAGDLADYDAIIERLETA